MAWQTDIIDVRSAHLQAGKAELSDRWHIAAHHYLYCLEQANLARDRRASRFFAMKLSRAYRNMGLLHKADYYGSLIS